MKRILSICLATGALLVASPPTESAERVVDQGSFIVYQGDRALGTERFTITSAGDSLVLTARADQTVRTADGDEQLAKEMILVSGSDYGLRWYQSNQRFRGAELIRGIVMGDTVFTLYRETDKGGLGTTMVLPPGRMFVVDPQMFSLFDWICLSLHGQTFERRPLAMLTLGTRDSVLEATAIHLGTETIRWGAKPVQARKLRLSDQATDFTVWVSPEGKLLRLAHGSSGLRVERDPPPVKRRTSPQDSGG